MKFLNLILENKADEFKAKYGRKFNEVQTQKILDNIPQKYWDWVGKKFDAIEFDNNFQSLVQNIKDFDKISSNLPKTDINAYQSVQELKDTLKDYANKPRREYQQFEGGNIVYDDKNFFVVNPQTHQASCYYGKGTKWCTSSESDSNFKKYNEDGKLFYFIDKRLKTDDPYYKVALLLKYEGDKSWWDAKDNSFTKGWILGTPELDTIMDNIQNYMEKEYSEQLTDFRNKLAAKKEKERIERLKIERYYRGLEVEAEQRKEDNEWELGPDCPEEGLEAHALLTWLEDNGDVDIQTSEDRNRIVEINLEIDRLNSEYDASENVETDILDEISDLEDERDELEKKITVYNIVPVGKHYNLTRFEVINNPDLEGRVYAVGDEDKIKTSAEEYVDQLIDDIGYGGFNRGFAQGFIDNDKVEDYFKDVYEEDVYQNPEVYLDESERQLSTKQEQSIARLKEFIEKIENQIEFLEQHDDTEEKIEELQEKLEEMQEEIEDIENDPDGDFPEDLIEEKVRELVDDATNDPLGSLDNFGANWEDFIDRDEFIEGVIDADGYGHTLNSYDGNADEIDVLGNNYWVMRIE